MNFNKLCSIFSILNEAVPLKTIKKKGWKRKYSGAYKIEILNKLFKDKDRLIFPLDVNSVDFISKENPLIEKIFDYINTHFQVTIRTRKDYIQGVAFKLMDNERKQPYKIGKLLNKKAEEGDKHAKELLEAFRDDPIRMSKKSTGFLVVISRHPYDLAGMSTDRNWTSCMDLGTKRINYPEKSENEGINKHYVPKDIQAGSIIAYLISEDDKLPNGKIALKKPLARILMKPCENNDNPKDVAFTKGRIYGTNCEEFSRFISDWLIDNINNNTEGKTYSPKLGLYDDGDTSPNFIKKSKSQSLISIAFFNELSNSPTNEKYHDRFTINTNNHNYVSFELIINFPLPDNLKNKLHNFRYSQNEAKPNYIKNIINDIPIKAYLHNLEYSEENNTIVAEYNYSTDYYEPPKYQDEDSLIEEMEYIFKHIGISKFNYQKSFEKIINHINSYNPDTDKQEELNKLNKMFDEHLEKVKYLNPDAFFLYNHPEKALSFNTKLLSILSSDNPIENFYQFYNSPNYKQEYNSYAEYMNNQKQLVKQLQHPGYYISDNFHHINFYSYWKDEIDATLNTTQFNNTFIEPLKPYSPYKLKTKFYDQLKELLLNTELSNMKNVLDNLMDITYPLDTSPLIIL